MPLKMDSSNAYLQEAAEALVTAYSASGLLMANLFQREEEDVTFPLVVSFGVKMIDEVI
jgi:hypothetical protein